MGCLADRRGVHAALIVVSLEIVQFALQVSLTPEDDVIKVLPSNRSDQAFDERPTGKAIVPGLEPQCMAGPPGQPATGGGCAQTY